MKTMNELRSEPGINGAHHLPLLIKGAAVTLLGTIGIAAVLAWGPISSGEAGTIFAFDNLRASPAKPDGRGSVDPSADIVGDARVRAKCEECGVVESTREIEQPGEGIDPGAAGGETGLSGKSAKSYEVTVRMKDGSSRVFMDAIPANWRPGERVIFIEGASRSNG